MRILAIDPGTKVSHYVEYDTEVKRPSAFGSLPNDAMAKALHVSWRGWEMDDRVVIEAMGNYQSYVGEETWETAYWIGEFRQAARPSEALLVNRTKVKHILTGHVAGVNDANLRAACIDRLGGKDAAIGGVKCRKCKGKGWFGPGRPVCPDCQGAKWLHPPGPCHGMKADQWQALALAMAAAEMLAAQGSEQEIRRCELASK